MAAMEEVCQAYWRPLYGFALSMNGSHQDAEDCVQGFLTRLSTGDFFQSVSANRGKLRSLLLVSFKRYIVDTWKMQSSQKRGGSMRDIALDGIHVEDTSESDPSLAYDQEWAKVVVDEAMSNLRERYQKQGNEKTFDSLEAYIDGTPLENSSQTAEQLNLSSVALKSAVHRIRRRFGEELQNMVRETVQHENDVDEEIRWLIKVLQA